MSRLCPGCLFSLYYKNISIFSPACRRAGYSRPPGKLAPEESCKPGGRASFHTKCGKKGSLCYYQKKAGQLTCLLLVVAETGFDRLKSFFLISLLLAPLLSSKLTFFILLSIFCQFSKFCKNNILEVFQYIRLCLVIEKGVTIAIFVLLQIQ